MRSEMSQASEGIEGESREERVEGREKRGDGAASCFHITPPSTVATCASVGPCLREPMSRTGNVAICAELRARLIDYSSSSGSSNAHP